LNPSPFRKKVGNFVVMKKNFLAFFNRTYPVDNSKPIVDNLLWGLIVFMVLYFFRPFGLSLYPGNIFLLALCFGLVTTASTTIYYYAVSMPLIRRVHPWRVWHEMVALFLMFLFIALCCSVFYVFYFHVSLSLELVLAFIQSCTIMGIFISVFATLLIYNRRLRNKMELMLRKTTEAQEGIVVTLHNTAVRGTDLTLPINDFLYAEVQRNDVTIHYLSDGKPTTAVIRSTLNNVKSELDYENIIQCHRSFLINVNNITSARGNSNGYQLRLGNSKEVVPVSRSFVPVLKSFIA
jgi:two-component system LytT family response regulator